MNVLLTPQTLQSLIGRGIDVCIRSGALLLRKGLLSIALEPDYWEGGAICFRVVKGRMLVRVLSMLNVLPLRDGRICLDLSERYPEVEIEDVRITDEGLLLRITFGGGRELGF